MNKEVNLGKEPVRKLFWVLALPAIISQVINALYNVVDRMYLGHIPEVGAQALTGVGVCFPIIMILSATAFLFGVGGAPRASIYMGKKENEKAEQIMGNCFFSMILVSVVLTILVFVFHEPLLYLFGASENTIGFAARYIRIYSLGTMAVMLTLGMNAFISTQGFSKISMLTVVIGAITNIVLDPIFIFGLNMGVQGAALATVLSQTLSAVWAIHFLRSEQSVLRLRKENFKLKKEVMLPCIALGVAPFIMQSTESLLVLCFNSSLLRYGGDLAVGAMTILSSVMQFAMLPIQGMTQGGQPIISYNYGANQLDRVKEAFKIQLFSCITYALLLWIFVMGVPSAFAKIFSSNVELIELTSWAIRIYLFAVPLMGVQIACQQTFIAFGNSKVSAFLAIFRKLIVLIPMIFILPMFLQDKVFAVFLAEPISDTIAVLTTVLLFMINFKKILKKEVR